MSDTVCWKCGREVLAGEVERRDVVTGSSSSTTSFADQPTYNPSGRRDWGGHSEVTRTDRVSLCRRCAERHDARQRARGVGCGLFVLIGLLATAITWAYLNFKGLI